MRRPVYPIKKRSIDPSPWRHLIGHVWAAAAFALVAWGAVGSALLFGAKLAPEINIIVVAAAATGGAVFAFRR
jgi:hypothetical protein